MFHAAYSWTGRVPILRCVFETQRANQEIFAVEVLLGVRFHDLINNDAELVGQSYVLGDKALAEVPSELRK